MSGLGLPGDNRLALRGEERLRHEALETAPCEWRVPGGLWVCLAGAIATLALAREIHRRLLVVHVSGMSMTPTLQPGDAVLAVRRRGASVHRGHVVIMRYPGSEAPRGASGGSRVAPRQPNETEWVIKRVAATGGDRVPVSVRPATSGTTIVPNGKLVVLGDNSRSLDSRVWGLIGVDDVIATVLARLVSDHQRLGLAELRIAPPPSVGC
jgi:signal peptidase I